MEGVRESITRASETLDEHVIRVGQGFTVSTQAVEASLDRGFKGLATNLESLRMVTENGNKALASSDPAKGFASLEGVLREVLKSADEHADAREKAIEAGLHKIELSLLPVVDSIGRLSGRVDALPEGLEAQFARLEMATKGLSGGLTEIVNVSRELAASQASAGGSDEVVKAVCQEAFALMKVRAPIGLRARLHMLNIDRTYRRAIAIHHPLHAAQPQRSGQQRYQRIDRADLDRNRAACRQAADLRLYAQGIADRLLQRIQTHLPRRIGRAHHRDDAAWVLAIIGPHRHRAVPTSIRKLLEDQQRILIAATAATPQHGGTRRHVKQIVQPPELLGHACPSPRKTALPPSSRPYVSDKSPET